MSAAAICIRLAHTLSSCKVDIGLKIAGDFMAQPSLAYFSSHRLYMLFTVWRLSKSR